MTIYDLKDVVMSNEYVKVYNEFEYCVYEGLYSGVPIQYAKLKIGKIRALSDILVINEVKQNYS